MEQAAALTPSPRADHAQPIGHLYVHVPFCTHICPYCAFVKTKNTLPLMKAFLPALKAELKRAVAEHEIQPRTVYFGGGTPSALSPVQLEDLFSGWPFGAVEEFTMEVNPATITPGKAELLRRVGVNRISLGVQSFDPAELKLLGRTHTAEQVAETVAILRRAGFDNISIDLMFALPGQDLAGWRRNLDAAVALEPQHVSAYNLTFEEDTEFLTRLESGEFKADSERDAAFFELTVEHLGPLGFEAYEISNFAREGWQSLHNRAYWEGKDYLGFGPGACSTVGLERYTNTGDVERYCRETVEGGMSPRETEPLTSHTRQVERIVLGLRTSRGVSLREMEPWQGVVDQLKTEGWLVTNGDRAILTPRGRLVADSIAEIFV